MHVPTCIGRVHSPVPLGVTTTTTSYCCHELKNPLHTIKGFVSCILDRVAARKSDLGQYVHAAVPQMLCVYTVRSGC